MIIVQVLFQSVLKKLGDVEEITHSGRLINAGKRTAEHTTYMNWKPVALPESFTLKKGVLYIIIINPTNT